MTTEQRQRLAELADEMRVFSVFHPDDVRRVQGWADTIGAILEEEPPSEPQSSTGNSSEVL